MFAAFLVAISLGLFIAAILSDYIKSTEGFEDVPELASFGEETEVTGKLADYDDDMDGEDDPRDLPWIASWSTADKAARRGQNCSVKFTDKGVNGTTIITTSKSCEAGLPHTRAGDRIIIPDSVPEALRAEILEHEMYHILQKREPQKWTKFYKQSWDFELFKEPPVGIPDHLIKARRGNPDTWQAPWCCWRSRYWSLTIYTDMTAPSLLKARTVWWDAWTSKSLDSEPEEWLEFFGSLSQPEHPHEISAVLLVSKDRTHEAGRRLENWAALNLVNPFNS